MPIAKLEFSLPTEGNEFMLAQKGGTFYSALWEIDQHCRSIIKHGHSYESVEDLAEYIRNQIPILDE